VHVECGLAYEGDNTSIVQPDNLTCFICYAKFAKALAGLNDPDCNAEYAKKLSNSPARATRPHTSFTLTRTSTPVPFSLPPNPDSAQARSVALIHTKIDRKNPAYMYGDEGMALPQGEADWWLPAGVEGLHTDYRLASPATEHVFSPLELLKYGQSQVVPTIGRTVCLSDYQLSVLHDNRSCLLSTHLGIYLDY
jgi:hypothetical protein